MPDAVTKAHGMMSVYEDTHPRLAKFLSDNLGDVMTFLAFPTHYHRKIRSTNVLERFNKEVKRRTKVVGAFPCDGSVLRLLIPLGVDTNAKWLDRKYASWEDMLHEEVADNEFTEIF
jgi:transposase-like protein